MTSTPVLAATAASAASVRGYVARSWASPNCIGFTNRETTTSSHAARAACISAAWPSWNAPIVGTRPIVRPSARARPT